MKEYKVVNWKMGLTNNNQRLEDCLNEYARRDGELFILQKIQQE